MTSPPPTCSACGCDTFLPIVADRVQCANCGLDVIRRDDGTYGPFMSWESPCDGDDEMQAIDAAELLTEPLGMSRLATYFDVSRWSMPGILKGIPGVMRCGAMHRVPVRFMPPAYHLAVGLVVPTTVDVVKIGDSCDAGRKDES